MQFPNPRELHKYVPIVLIIDSVLLLASYVAPGKTSSSSVMELETNELHVYCDRCCLFTDATTRLVESPQRPHDQYLRAVRGPDVSRMKQLGKKCCVHNYAINHRFS